MLSCLVGAMTCTATLLAWMDPSIPPPPNPLTERQLVGLAEALVNDSVVIEPNRWHDVDVVAGQTVARSGVWLAAQADDVQGHFFIDSTGRPSRASRWCAQRPSPGYPHTVRIRVTPPHIGAPVSTAQWLSIRALVDALDKAVAPRLAPLQVDFEPALLNVERAEASTSRDLQSTGLIAS